MQGDPLVCSGVDRPVYAAEWAQSCIPRPALFGSLNIIGWFPRAVIQNVEQTDRQRQASDGSNHEYLSPGYERSQPSTPR